MFADPFLSFFLFVIGLIWGSCLGSFATALVWRIPEGLPWAYDRNQSPPGFVRSMCPKCNRILSPVDLVPIFSWLFMGGKCRTCREPIGVIYPVIEIFTAIVCGIIFLIWGFTLESVFISFSVLFFGIFLICGVFKGFWSKQLIVILVFLGLGLAVLG